MGFYTSPSFFMALATAVVPAAVLGFMERRIKYYGFALFSGQLTHIIERIING